MLLIFFDSSLNSLVLSSVPYSSWTSAVNGVIIERTLAPRVLVINSNKSPTESPDPTSDAISTCLKGTCNTIILVLASYLRLLASSFQLCGSGGSMKLGHVWNRLQILHVIFRVIYMSRYACEQCSNDSNVDDGDSSMRFAILRITPASTRIHRSGQGRLSRSCSRGVNWTRWTCLIPRLRWHRTRKGDSARNL